MTNSIQQTNNNQTVGVPHTQPAHQKANETPKEKPINTYVKYCPNVWLVKCADEHQKGDIIQVANKYGNETDCEIHNLVVKNSSGYFYSITRCDGLNRQTYAERKAEKYNAWAQAAKAKSEEWCNKANEGRDFLALGEPIKIGHHSEKKHRALIERNHQRMSNSMDEVAKAQQHEYKAEYWESRKNDIDLSMPESVEFFTYELEKAEALQTGLKNGTVPRLHSFSLHYATKAVKELKAKVELARKLWS